MLKIDEKLCSDLKTEIRKLKPTELCHIAMLLDVNDDWKMLMSVIPKEEGSCISKFNNNHSFMIEQASKVQHRNCAEILLEEWGTMGKKRPTVNILLDLLVKAELYRVADYINIDILKRGETKRPNHGPASRVDNLSEIFADTGNESNLDILDDVYEKYLLQSDDIENSFEKVVARNTSPNIINQVKKRENLKKYLGGNNECNESSEERLDFGNKTTKIFDDIEPKQLSMADTNFIKFDVKCNYEKIVAEKSVDLEAAAKLNPLNSDDQLQSDVKIRQKIPVFIEDSTFSKYDSNEDIPKHSQNECDIEKNLNDSFSHSSLINKLENVNISKERSSNYNNFPEQTGSEKTGVSNIPTFLTSSSIG